MKWIYSLFIFLSLASFGQSDDSAKYIHYPYQYGIHIPRLWADSVLKAKKLVKFTGLTSATDTTTYKPLIIDASGNVNKMSSWPVTPGTDTTSLSNRINLKLNISDTTNKWVNDIRRSNDSVYAKKGDTWEFKYKDSTGGAAITNAGGTGDTLLISNTVKRLEAGYGVVHTVTGSKITQSVDTSSTNHLVTQSDLNDTSGVIRAIYQLSPMQDFGQIYLDSVWVNTDEFTLAGNTTATINGNYIDFTTSSGGVFTQYAKFGQLTELPRWTNEARFKITSTIAVPNYGVGIGLKTTNTHSVYGDILGRVGTYQSPCILYINKSDGTQLATVTGPTISQNDVLDLKMTFTDSTVTFSVYNVTTSSSTTNLTYNYSTSSSTNILPNSCNWAIYEFGGTQQLQYRNIYSTAKKFANAAMVMDSKAAGYFATNFAGRVTNQLNVTYSTTIVYSGGGDQSTDVEARVAELLKLSPAQVLYGTGSNDKRWGSFAQWKTSTNNIINKLLNAHIRVGVFMCPEDSTAGGVGLSEFNAYLKTIAGVTYINVWDTMSTNNILKSIYNGGDGIHPNQAGNNAWYSAIVASGFLNNTNDRKYQLRTNDKIVTWAGDSAYLNANAIALDNYIPKVSVNTLKQSNIKDNGSIITLTGNVACNGPNGSFVINRQSNNSADYAWYNPAGTLTLRDGINTADRYRLNLSGEHRFDGLAAYFTMTSANTFDAPDNYFTNANHIYGTNGHISFHRHTSNVIDFNLYNDTGRLVIYDNKNSEIRMSIDTARKIRVNGLAAPSTYNIVVHSATDSSLGQVPVSTLPFITSINSQTGPSITISGDATTGVSASASSNTVTIATTFDIESFNSDANNTSTTETDLYSSTISANKLTLNGKGLRFRITGTNNDATATAQIKGYFAGTNIFDSGALTMSAAGDWVIDMEIQRTTSTTAAATVTFSCANTTVTLPVKYTALTSQDWTTTNIFKVTGTAGGGGGGSNDITAHAGKVVFVP